MRLRTIALGVLLASTAPALAQQSADDVLPRWAQEVGRSVQLTGCFLTSATPSQMYCDAKASGLRLYIDTATLDPGDLQTAIRTCPDWQLRPECEVALSGTMQASFGSPLLVDAQATFLAAGPAEPARQAAAASGALQEGEYACVGSGGSVLAGLGFIVVDASRYTDLDRTMSGTYAVSGSEVSFSGGHLDGQTGRDLSGTGAFVIGEMATCEPW